MFVGRALHFDVSLFSAYQSNHGWCKVNQDNPMMIGFVRDEMTLKTTLLKCDPMVISNVLVSWFISLEDKL
jgi:hypothetical protein